MPKAKFATLTSWSFSVYCSYIKCPLSVCFEKIQKIRITEPPNPFFAKGDCAHATAEQFVTGAGRVPSLKITLPPVEPGGSEIKVDLTSVKPLLVQLRKRKDVVTEQEWAFTREWKPTGWFDKDAWLRMKTDVCGHTLEPPTVDIWDWKTGKIHVEDHQLQRSLYGLGGLLLVKLGVLAGGSKDVKLTAQHVYIDGGATATEVFAMKDLEPLRRGWLARIEYMMKDTQYPAKPSSMNCRFCKFNKNRTGGPCDKGL